GTASLVLRTWPVSAVSSVSYLSTLPDTWTAYNTTTDGLYIVQPVKQEIAFRLNAFPCGSQNVKVTYTAGPLSVPEAVKAACRIALKAMWDTKDKQNQSVVSQTFPGGQTVVYDKKAMPEMFYRLLAPYRRAVWV